MKRSFLFLIPLILIFFSLPVIAVIVAVIIGFSHSFDYYEIIIFGIIIDIFYQSTFSIFSLSLPLYTPLTFALFISLYFLKKRMNFHVI